MFDLEKSIADWRKQMLAAGIKTPVPLEELESHLREEIERQMESGTNPHQAFENSVQQIGQADELKGEFKKTCGMYQFPKSTKRTVQIGRWSLLWWGIGGLVVTWISSLVRPLHPSPAVWIPNYVTFTTIAVCGLVIGFARWHTKWTLLWISSMGFIGAMSVSVVCRFVFHGSDGVSLVLQRVHLPWWGFSANWVICIILGLFTGFSNRTLWLKKLPSKTTAN